MNVIELPLERQASLDFFSGHKGDLVEWATTSDRRILRLVSFGLRLGPEDGSNIGLEALRIGGGANLLLEEPVSYYVAELNAQLPVVPRAPNGSVPNKVGKHLYFGHSTSYAVAADGGGQLPRLRAHPIMIPPNRAALLVRRSGAQDNVLGATLLCEVMRG